MLVTLPPPEAAEALETNEVVLRECRFSEPFFLDWLLFMVF